MALYERIVPDTDAIDLYRYYHYILSENRNRCKSLVYILVLIFLPVIGLLVYHFVGRKPLFKKWLFNKKWLADRQKIQQYYQQLNLRWKSDCYCRNRLYWRYSFFLSLPLLSKSVFD